MLIASFSLTFTSCGDENDDPKQEENEAQLYGGTWKCIPTAEQKESEYPYSISFDKNGSLTGKFLGEKGEDMQNFTGSWELKGRILSIIAIFRDDEEDETEEWTCKVLTLTQSELVVNWDGEKYTFVR